MHRLAALAIIVLATAGCIGSTGALLLPGTQV
jgi:hypothetical protein